MPTSRSPLWVRCLLLALVLLSIVRAWYARWTCDDAFISFRYAENLVNGHGLVFNPGEQPVEAYTNFLWNVLVAGAMALGIDPVGFGYVFGIGCYVATILLLARLSGRLGASPSVPIAAAVLALHEHAIVFSTCGLETALFTLLVTGSLATLATARTSRSFMWLGLLTVLTTMTRIDGSIIATVCGVWVLVATRGERISAVLLPFLTPWLIIYMPYFLWRYGYYGYFFPNIYYAKSASEPYLSQGLDYLGLYFRCYYVLAIGVLLTLSTALSRRRVTSATGFGDPPRLARMILSFSLSYLAYVAWVGGDFMFSRFCLPVTPVILIGLELWSTRLSTLARRLFFGFVAMLATVFTWYPDGLQPGDSERPMVVEERNFYPRERMEDVRSAGDVLRNIFQDTTARVVIDSFPQCTLAYFARFPYVLESTGLTDLELARRPVERRGRPGHERSVDAALVIERKIHLYISEQKIPDHLGNLGLRDIDLGGIPAVIITYDRDLMDALKTTEGVVFTPFDEFLDDYIENITDRTKQEVLADYQAFRTFYFDYNDDRDDRGRLDAIERYLR